MNKKYYRSYLVRITKENLPQIIPCPRFLDAQWVKTACQLGVEAELEVLTNCLNWQTQAVVFNKHATKMTCNFKNGEVAYGNFCVVLLGKKGRELNINDFRGLTSIDMAQITLRELKLI